MKIRTSIAAVSAAALIGGGGALLIPAVASAHSTTHTLKFIAVTKKQVFFTKTTAGEQETDYNSKGKIIGFDMLYVSFNSKTGKGTGNATLVTKGGVLYAVLALSSSPKTTGRVTGGVGAFKGATGKVVGKALNKAGTKTAVTITYHT